MFSLWVRIKIDSFFPKVFWWYTSIERDSSHPQVLWVSSSSQKISHMTAGRVPKAFGFCCKCFPCRMGENCDPARLQWSGVGSRPWGMGLSRWLWGGRQEDDPAQPMPGSGQGCPTPAGSGLLHETSFSSFLGWLLDKLCGHTPIKHISLLFSVRTFLKKSFVWLESNHQNTVVLCS